MIHAWPDQKIDPYGFQRRITVEVPGTPVVMRKRLIVFRISGGTDGPLDLIDCYLPALSMLAMAEGMDIHVHGRASQQALMNAIEFQRVWLKWQPRRFKRLAHIEVDEIAVPSLLRPRRAIQAFSGGLDAIFTTWFHKIGGEPDARLPIDRAVFVHGFDIALKDREGFSISLAKGKEILDTVGVEMSALRTNLRGAIAIGWETFHGAAIAAALGQFSNNYTHATIGSGGAYDGLHLPWGSTPITDHLMSGARISFVHDGAGFDRSEKVKAIANWPIALKNLRVCWRNSDKSKNCGVCEKCIATALAFKAWGYPIPPSLKVDLSDEDILACRTSNDNQRDRLKAIRVLALANGINDSWVDTIRRKFS